MAQCEANVEDQACDKKAVKTYRNSVTGKEKSFCKDHGPWTLPYSDDISVGTWEEIEVVEVS
jgi:hypothetical protein